MRKGGEEGEKREKQRKGIGADREAPVAAAN